MGCQQVPPALQIILHGKHERALSEMQDSEEILQTIDVSGIINATSCTAVQRTLFLAHALLLIAAVQLLCTLVTSFAVAKLQQLAIAVLSIAAA